MKFINKTKLIVLLFLITASAQAQNLEKSFEKNTNNLPVREYTISIDQAMVTKAGKTVMGMTVNGGIPGPTLNFNEGDYAIIYVKNNMDEETSIHWHGLLLPNFYDGVPYLNTPPIKPGETFKYEFPIKQAGTYWYHSHTMLQEQSGVYGSIVIQPKKQTLQYDKELVLVLSDWTNEKPMNVLKNLKRGTEWYGLKKGTANPLKKVIKGGALGAQIDFWRQRMEGADIADVYYPAFLINGEEIIEYPKFKAGEKVRLRIINGGASSSFWMTFGGNTPQLVAADGLDIVPVDRNKTFIGIAETYDFIVTIPENKKIEFRITAQDGSGTASAFFGSGEVLPAEILPKPDKISMMKKMAKMDMKMGAHALKYQPKKDERYKMLKEYGMQADKMGNMNMEKSTMKKMEGEAIQMNHEKKVTLKKDTGKMDHTNMEANKMDNNHDMKSMNMPKNEKPMENMEMGGMDLYSEYNYDYLKSIEKTAYNKNLPVKEILLNLTGNMNRYIWSMNGVPLAETEKIKIKKGEVTRVTLNNLTMMHHPMHLHGHFFRVLNKNGEFSPLKHTVNVPPMQKVTIEFYGSEYGDWFFHCHILYHMMGGMARVISYDTPKDPRMNEFPVNKLIKETNLWYTWGVATAASHHTSFNLSSSNLRNQFNASLEYGWNKNLEGEITYNRYLHDYLRVFGGLNIENKDRNSLNNFKTTAVAGVRFLTPYLFALDVRFNSDLVPRLSLGRSIMIFPKLSVYGYYEYQIDFGLINTLPLNKNFMSETVWSSGVRYMMSRNLSLMASYDNRFGAGGGLVARF